MFIKLNCNPKIPMIPCTTYQLSPIGIKANIAQGMLRKENNSTMNTNIDEMPKIVLKSSFNNCTISLV